MVKSKAIIFDLDGTAVDSPKEKSPSQQVIDSVVQHSKDYYMCSATGRVWTFARPILQTLHLTDPCIISAGTQICNPQTGEILWQKTLTADSLFAATKVLQDYPEYKLLFNDNDEHAYFHGGISPQEFSPTEPIYFLEQVFVPDELAIKIHARLSQIPGVAAVMVVAQKPGTRDIHIINQSATKEYAVAELLSIIKVNKENTIGIGDGHNDIHLFNAVGYKVAMGNAVPELKSVADQVINSVQDNGLATYLDSFVKS